MWYIKVEIIYKQSLLMSFLLIIKWKRSLLANFLYRWFQPNTQKVHFSAPISNFEFMDTAKGLAFMVVGEN